MSGANGRLAFAANIRRERSERSFDVGPCPISMSDTQEPSYASRRCGIDDLGWIQPLRSPTGITHGKSSVASMTDTKLHQLARAARKVNAPPALHSVSRSAIFSQLGGRPRTLTQLPATAALPLK